MSSALRSASDPTFRNYNASQAQAYAAGRKDFNQTVLQYVLTQHVSSNGRLGTLLDVGCGPGNASKEFALQFENAIGCDPSEVMVAHARSMGLKSKNGNDVNFAVCSAEEIISLIEIDDLKIEEEGVDMITCGLSAHWFDLGLFYPEAARLLRPSGSLAMWTIGATYVHPKTTPNSSNVQAILDEFSHVTLLPYTNKGNMLSYNVYEDLPLPWDLSAGALASLFPKQQFYRKTWNKNGEILEGRDGFFGGVTMSLAQLKKTIGTASMVTRWREAHPALAGTSEDCVETVIRDIKSTMGSSEDYETVKLDVGFACGLVMLKKAT